MDVKTAAHSGTFAVSTPSDREIVLTRLFDAPRELVYEAMTKPEHIRRWMQATGMTLVGCEVDLRPGGNFRYTFERPGGRRIEVRGAYESVDPPRQFVYRESYDFSPLEMQVTTSLEAEGDATVFRQRLQYASKGERDEDYPGVAQSSQEAYARLEAYLAELGK